MRTQLFRALFTMSLSLALASSAFAQAGMLKGVVMDAQGNPIEGAEVEIVSNDSARAFETKTDRRGEFVQIGLRSGSYKVTATKDNMAQTLNANVRQGNNPGLQFNLTPVSNLSAGDVQKLAALQAAFTAANDAVKAGNHSLAVTKYQEALAAQPACRDCHVNIGYSQTELKQYDAAEASFKAAIALDANSADAYSGLAALYNAQKKYDLATEAGAKAAALAPAGVGGGAEASYNQGVILFNAQKFAEAKVQFEAAVAANPQMALAQYQLGMTALNLGLIPDAVKALEAYLQVEPNGEKAAEVNAALPGLKSMIK